MKDRYMICIGKYGNYFYDREESKPMELKEVLNILNFKAELTNISESFNDKFKNAPKKVIVKPKDGAVLQTKYGIAPFPVSPSPVADEVKQTRKKTDKYIKDKVDSMIGYILTDFSDEELTCIRKNLELDQQFEREFRDALDTIARSVYIESIEEKAKNE